MADAPIDPALKAAAETLAGVVTALSDYKVAAGSDEANTVQSALYHASRAYALLNAMGRPDVPIYFPPCYY